MFNGFAPPCLFLKFKHRHKFIIGEVISESSKLHSSKLQISMINIFDWFVFHPLRSNIEVVQHTFYVCILHRSLFCILTLNPVEIPTVSNLEFQLCRNCNFTLNPFSKSNWFLERCRYLWIVWKSFPFRTNEQSSPLKHQGDPAHILCEYFTLFSILHSHSQSSRNTDCV